MLLVNKLFFFESDLYSAAGAAPDSYAVQSRERSYLALPPFSYAWRYPNNPRTPPNGEFFDTQLPRTRHTVLCSWIQKMVSLVGTL